MTYLLVHDFLLSAEHWRFMEKILPKATWEPATHNGQFSKWLPNRHNFMDGLLARIVLAARNEMDQKDNSAGDVIFLRYKKGDYVPSHKDVHGRGNHMRCGILLQSAEKGGELIIDDKVVPLEPRDAIIYRADQVEHSVSRVEKGTRYLLTVGTVF